MSTPLHALAGKPGTKRAGKTGEVYQLRIDLRGTKNPKASFFADSLSECRRKQRRSKEDLPELANITNLTGYSPLASKAED